MLIKASINSDNEIMLAQVGQNAHKGNGYHIKWSNACPVSSA
jgi:hypothetical protein